MLCVQVRVMHVVLGVASLLARGKQQLTSSRPKTNQPARPRTRVDSSRGLVIPTWNAIGVPVSRVSRTFFPSPSVSTRSHITRSPTAGRAPLPCSMSEYFMPFGEGMVLRGWV